MPLPTSAPMRGAQGVASIASPASSSAMRPAATANWAKRSIRRATRLSMKSAGSKPVHLAGDRGAGVERLVES